jgi:uncharacterized membrane protein
MTLARLKVLKTADLQMNTIAHSPPRTAETREVVKPSSDLLYSICFYDVSKTPLQISATVPDTYRSISLYQNNTDNFFVKNDRQVEGEKVNFLLVGKDASDINAGNAEVIISPTDTGVILFRMLITDTAKLPELIRIQKKAHCGPLQ